MWSDQNIKNILSLKRVFFVPVVLVNRFTPPDAAPTAAALMRLTTLLAAQAPMLDLRVIGTDRAYVGGGTIGEGGLWRRGLAAFTDGRRLATQAAEHAAVLSLTDPPFLAFHLARRLPLGCLWIEWTMDLYPAAVRAALGLARGRHCRYWGGRRPDLRLHLGPGQAAFAAPPGAPPSVILPAGVRDPVGFTPEAPAQDGRIRLIYAGNLGRAHWADALPLLAAACDPARFQLTVAAYGAGAAQTRARLRGFSHVDWRDGPLADAELDAGHAHIASLRDNWTHVCVPSKAVSALCRGRPILFFGAAASDVWGWADGGGWRLDPNPAAVAHGLPGVLQEIAAPASLAAATRRAQEAGDRLRLAESRGVKALAAWLDGSVKGAGRSGTKN